MVYGFVLLGLIFGVWGLASGVLNKGNAKVFLAAL